MQLTHSVHTASVHTATVSTRRLDATTAGGFVEETLALASRTQGALVLDLSCVEFIDSIGIAALASIRRELGDRPVVVAGLGAYAQTVARVTHLHHLFDIYATASAAVQALST